MTDTQERFLIEMLDDEETKWFARRRLQALAGVGLYWNPDLHPRGRDGKFIEKYGWVRWLLDGKWQRGRVENLLPEGQIIVSPDNDEGNPVKIASNHLYSLPTPKGKIADGPDPVSTYVPEGWEKTGEQGGSNPGGFYTTKSGVSLPKDYRPEAIESQVKNFNFEKMDSVDPVGKPPESLFAVYKNDDGEYEPFFKIGLPADHYDEADKWNEIKGNESLEVWEANSPADVVGLKQALGQDIESDTQFYVKRTHSSEHASNEVLANEFYKIAGVPVPDLYFGDNQTVASKVLVSSSVNPDAPPPTMLSKVKDDPAIKKQIRENMAVDAWLANWDAVGMTYDNVIVVDDVAYRIDTGGSLSFRAKGSPKGGAFGHTVGELTTFLDPSTNPSASAIFGGVTQDELKGGAERVAAISPKQIKEMVESVGLSYGLADILIGRRKNLLDTVGVVDPFVTYKPPGLHTVTKTPVSDEMFWNPVASKWQPGLVKKSASSLMEEVLNTIGNYFKSGDENKIPEPGDFIAVGTFNERGLYRVDTVQEDGIATAHSALDPNNDSVYTFGSNQYRVLDFSEVPEDISSAYLQYKVAEANERLRNLGLSSLVENSINREGYEYPPILNVAFTKKPVGDAFWNMKPGEYVFHKYEDDDGIYNEVFRIKGVSDKTVSFSNVLNGKERIMDWNDWVDEAHSDWHIPDAFTQNLTEGLLQRDKLIPTDVVDSVEFVNETVDPDLTINTPDTTAFNTTPIDLETLGIVGSLASENGVNVNIQVGESISSKDIYSKVSDLVDLDNMDTTEAKAYLQEFFGKTIIFSNHTDDQRTGLWYVTDATVSKATWENEITIRFSLKSSTGQSDTLVLKSWTPEVLVQEALAIDASIPQTHAVFAQNGDIISEGAVLGAWGKTYYDFKATIFPEFSISGKQTSFTSSRKKDLKFYLGKYSIPQLQPAQMMKSETVKGSESSILSQAMVKKASDFEVGSVVISPDGKLNKVLPNEDLQAPFPSWLKVEDPEGKVHWVNANLVIPSEESIPSIEEAPAEFEKMPLDPPPFWPLKYGDGNDPRIGQYVKAGKGHKQVEGTITWVGPPEGKQAKIAPLAAITTPEGKVVRKTLSNITLVKEIDGAPKTPLPDDAKASVEIIEADFTDSQIQDSAIKYISTDGKTIGQMQSVKDKWLSGSPKRKLTKDGYAPQIGMRVKTSNGAAAVVIDYGDVYKNPNKVKVVEIVSGDEKLATVSTMWVDHQAELADAGDGPTVDFIKGITTPTSVVTLPDGTAVYVAKGKGTFISGRSTDMYFIIDEDGKIITLGDDFPDIKYSYEGTSSFLSGVYSTGAISKVAVIDSDSTNMAAWSTSSLMDGMALPAAFVQYDPSLFSHEEALSGHYTSLTEVAVEGVEATIPIPSSHLANLPKPLDAVDISGAELEPEPPPITNVLGGIDQTPQGLAGVKSVVGATHHQIADKDSSGRGSGVEFSLGDAEYIEDMLVQTQIARDESNNEFAEISFRLLENHAEAVADKLLLTGTDVTYGKWMPRSELLYASKIKAGDAIQVRRSASSELLKPSLGDTPNVRVITDPVLLGTDKKGVPVYRLVLATSDGTTGSMDVEERALPSLKAFDWDSHAVASQSSSIKATLTNKAQQNGWQSLGGIGYDKAAVMPNGSITIDETGAKKFTFGQVATGAGSSEKGSRLARQFSDGSHVIINAVPSSVSGTSMGDGGSGGEIRRWNEAGLVTIRVPVGLAEDDPAAFQASISQAMEAVGIPPEKQAPASPDQIAIYALNRLYKNFAPVYKHREAPVKSPNPNDPAAVELLERMNQELEQYLGRKVTFDDFEIKLGENGFFRVGVSAEVAKAITARQGQAYYKHHISGYTYERALALLSSPNDGLMGGSFRYNRGVLTTGMSTNRDMTKGSGNRVYLTGMSYKHSQSFNAADFIFSPDAINSLTGIYVNTSDRYGTRSPSNDFIKIGNASEYMMKDLLDLSQMAYYVAGDSSIREKLLADLKELGITHIGDRPIEEFIITNLKDIDVTDPDFLDLGVSDGIKLTELLAKYGIPVTQGAEEVEEVEVAEGALV